MKIRNKPVYTRESQLGKIVQVKNGYVYMLKLNNGFKQGCVQQFLQYSSFLSFEKYFISEIIA